MTGLSDPSFRLIGSDGAPLALLSPPPDLSPSEPWILDVARLGPQAVIGALRAHQETKRSVVLVRDPSVALPSFEALGTEARLYLQTSGTTGAPKWMAYDLARLSAAIAEPKLGSERARWFLTYHPASFAGLQVILSALKAGVDLVVPPLGASVPEMCDLAVHTQVTHMSATPTFWRAFLMALGGQKMGGQKMGGQKIDLKAVTLGGELADQAILDALRAQFPKAHLRHIYATTELGVILSVNDGKAGFPSAWLGLERQGLRLEISEDQTLVAHAERLKAILGTEAWDTKDLVRLEGDRVYFEGRLDSMVNIGGVKVNPEAVETYILRCEGVRDVRIMARKNPITGSVLVADIILKPFGLTTDPEDIKAVIRAHILGLERSHRPMSVRFVEQLALGQSGKKLRQEV